MSEEEREPKHPDLVIVEDYIDRLRAHFDTVQIFVTRQEKDNDTTTVIAGSGNYYARFGSVNLWIEREKNGIS